MNNKKKDITFNSFLTSIRTYKKIEIEEVAYGLYTKSMMYYIESGQRLPDYLMRNRILERLGLNNDYYEDFLNADEYARHLEKINLEELIETRQTDKAKEVLKSLLDSCDQSHKIEYQFLLDMQGRVHKQEDAEYAILYEDYKQAVEVTMPDIDLSNIQKYLLATVEYYLLVEMIGYAVLAKTMDITMAIGYISKIADHLLEIDIDGLNKCKVYPYIVVKLYELYKDAGYLDKNDRRRSLARKVNLAISLLRENCRLYYVIELLEMHKDLSDAYSVEENNQNESLLDLFKSLFAEYSVEEKMGYSCYIYEGLSVYNIGQLIKSRRIMLGITRQELAKGVCTLKTLERIENNETNPQRPVFKGLLAKLRINADYRRSEIITNDYKNIVKYYEYKDSVNERDYENVNVIINYLKRRLDKGYPENVQVLARITNVEQLRAKKISLNQFVENMKLVLKLTGIDLEAMPTIYGYLSRSEILCLYNLMMKVYGNDMDNGLTQRIIEPFEALRKNPKNHIQYTFYELVMSWYANVLSDEKKFNESNMLCNELIKESLQKRKNTEIAKVIYIKAWNKAVESKNIFDISLLADLEKSYLLYLFSNKKTRAAYIKEKMDCYKSSTDWTE
ncbi:MAG: helix-turn-helix transcriptional regulator [Butyrivibrio sp.]|nr:helix-turn-helix transcriptional regulator [Butyrivibrio sp.]